jgi:hypothetical protein
MTHSLKAFVGRGRLADENKGPKKRQQVKGCTNCFHKNGHEKCTTFQQMEIIDLFGKIDFDPMMNIRHTEILMAPGRVIPAPS